MRAIEHVLLAALHNGLLQERPYEAFVALLRKEARADFATLTVVAATGLPLVDLWDGAAVPAHLSAALRQQHGRHPLATQRMREGRVYALEELIDPDDPEHRSLQDPLRLTGTTAIRMVRVTTADGTSALLCCAGSSELSSVVSALLAAFAPHLRTAVQVLIALGRERRRGVLAVTTLAKCQIGWAELDREGRILDTTGEVERLLAEGIVLRRDAHDRLILPTARLNRVLSGCLNAGDFHDRPTVLMSLSRAPRTELLLRPPAGGESDGQTAAIVFLRTDRPAQSDLAVELGRLFDLSPSEARLAWLIAQGRTIAEAAAELGITRETARTYSKKIFAKTGVRGQAELVRLISTSVLAIA